MFIFGVIFALIAGVLFGLIGPTTKLAYNADAAVALVIFYEIRNCINYNITISTISKKFTFKLQRKFEIIYFYFTRFNFSNNWFAYISYIYRCKPYYYNILLISNLCTYLFNISRQGEN